MSRQDIIVNTILSETQEQLLDTFRIQFGEEIESESMQAFIASMQVYAGDCMRKALLKSKEDIK